MHLLAVGDVLHFVPCQILLLHHRPNKPVRNLSVVNLPEMGLIVRNLILFIRLLSTIQTSHWLAWVIPVSRLERATLSVYQTV